MGKQVKDYEHDSITGIVTLIKQQVMFEIIAIASECETYAEFRKTLYGMALQYQKQMEKELGNK